MTIIIEFVQCYGCSFRGAGGMSDQCSVKDQVHKKVLSKSRVSQQQQTTMNNE